MMAQAPEWVRSVPQNPFYYHGVAMAPKTTMGDYRERARQAALSELAASISVNISSNSMLNQFEFDDTFSEFFRDNITVTTQQYLEGAEIAGNWETPNEYWVYYRLSRSEYERAKQDRIRRALDLSLSRLDQATDLSQRGRPIEALGFMIQAVEDISNFLAEDLMVDHQGSRVAYPSLLNSSILEQLDELSIDFPDSRIHIKPGSTQAMQPMQVFVRDGNGREITGAPVSYRFSWIPGRTFQAVTDASGAFFISFQGLKPSHKNQQIAAEINFSSIISIHSSELSVRRLLGGFSSNTFLMNILVESPVFFVEVVSEISADGRNADIVFEELRKMVSNSGLQVTSNKEEADYFLIVALETIAQNQQGNRFTASIRSQFQTTDKLGNILYNFRTDEITGFGNSFPAALESAHQSLNSRININVFPGIMNVLF